MNMRINITLIIILIACSVYVRAQQNYPTKTVDGVEYYVYQVQAAEGLYSISKKFGVSQSEINNANPQILEGLKAGQIILIPKNKTKQIDESQQSSDKNEYVLHTVERKQTLFAISRKYNVSQDAIIQANPQIKEGMKQGDVLRIPVKKKETSENVQPHKTVNDEPVSEAKTFHIDTDEMYATHRIQPKETLYSISREYNVSVEDIKKLNPELTDVLKTGTVLKIPKNGKKPNLATGNISTNNAEPVIKPKEPKFTYRIAYLLPFMQNNGDIDPTVGKFIEFYLGSLLAINNAKNGEINFEIHTFDTEKSETKIFEIINNPEMQKIDLIIGPAYTSQIPILVDFAMRRRINTVIPFSSKVENIEQNPYVFQFNPDQDFQNDYVANLLKNKFNGTNVVFVETGNSNIADEGTDFYNFLMKIFDKQRIPYKKINVKNFSSIEFGMSVYKKNIFIFDTGDYKMVKNYLSKLYDYKSQYDVDVLGQYSWRNENGRKPKMYYVAPFSGNSRATEFYEEQYQKYYGKKNEGLNPRYDLIGYDITTYFLSTMKKDGFTFNRATQSLDFNNGVQSDFHFKRIGKNGGFMNQQLYLIEDDAKAQ